MTAIDRIRPPSLETSSEEDFKAQFRWWFEEEVGNVGFLFHQATELLEKIQKHCQDIPAEIREELAQFIAKAVPRVDSIMEIDDPVPVVENTATWLKGALSEGHCGDCTAHPAGCMRCSAEQLYNLPSTVTWRSKREGRELFHEALAAMKVRPS